MKPTKATIRRDLEATQLEKEQARKEILGVCDLLGKADEPTTLADALITLGAFANLRAAVCEYLHAEDAAEGVVRLALLAFAGEADKADDVAAVAFARAGR